MLTRSDRHRTAVHEAGHAIAAWRLGIAVERVTIIADDEALGHCVSPYKHFEVSPDEWGEDAVRNHIVVTLAGAEAERRHCGDLPPGSCDHDHKVAVDLAMSVSGNSEQTNALLENLRLCAVELLEENWRHVETLAWRLLEDDATDVAAVLSMGGGPRINPAGSKRVADGERPENSRPSTAL